MIEQFYLTHRWDCIRYNHFVSSEPESNGNKEPFYTS